MATLLELRRKAVLTRLDAKKCPGGYSIPDSRNCRPETHAKRTGNAASHSLVDPHSGKSMRELTKGTRRTQDQIHEMGKHLETAKARTAHDITQNPSKDYGKTLAKHYGDVSGGKELHPHDAKNADKIIARSKDIGQKKAAKAEKAHNRSQETAKAVSDRAKIHEAAKARPDWKKTIPSEKVSKPASEKAKSKAEKTSNVSRATKAKANRLANYVNNKGVSYHPSEAQEFSSLSGRKREVVKRIAAQRELNKQKQKKQKGQVVHQRDLPAAKKSLDRQARKTGKSVIAPITVEEFSGLGTKKRKTKLIGETQKGGQASERMFRKAIHS